LDIGVLGYIGIFYHKEHPPEVWHIPPETPCICRMAVTFLPTEVVELSTGLLNNR
jgi:hypothetical protein